MPRRPAHPENHHLKRRKGGAFVCQLAVPKHLRSRAGRAVLERYLGTSDVRLARRKRDAALAAFRAYLDALDREESGVADGMRHARLNAQHRIHAGLVADPTMAPQRAMDTLGDLDFEREARDTLESLGLADTKANFDMAFNAIGEAYAGALVLWDRGLTPPRPTYFSVQSEPGTTGPSLTEVAEAYANANGTGTTAKTRNQTAHSVRLLTGLIGDQPARNVTGRDIVRFIEALGSIDPDYRWDKAAVAMPLPSLQERYPGAGLSAATINRHLSNISAALKWAARQEEWEGWTNPTAGKSVRPGEDDSDTAWSPFTDAEIGRLLDGLTLPEEPARNFAEGIVWAILIGAYSGMRAGEIGDLTGVDVDAWEDGTPVFRVKQRGQGKTASAKRVIPVHPELARRGLIDYARRCGDKRLIGCDAKTLSKRFPAFRTGRNVDRDNVAFHSLRKSFTTKLERLDVPSDTAALLLGHKGLRSFTYGRYSGGHAMTRLAEIIGGVSYGLESKG